MHRMKINPITYIAELMEIKKQQLLNEPVSIEALCFTTWKAGYRVACIIRGLIINYLRYAEIHSKVL